MEIKVYSSQSCSRCIAIKAQLRAKGINFQEGTLDHSIIEKARLSNVFTLPIITLNGNITTFEEVLEQWNKD